MYRSSLFLTAILMGTPIAFVQPAAAVKSVSEVEAIARSVTVEIKLQQKVGNVGSGVIIHRQGDLYTLVTNGHVVCGVNYVEGKLCAKVPAAERYILTMADGQSYQVRSSSVKLMENTLDLAIIQFRSDRNYAVAKVSAPGSLKAEDDVYTSGFPLEKPGFTFGAGKALAVVNKRLAGDSGGYTIVYNSPTLRGMSGGGVFDGNGQLVAIHGQGDKYRENTEIDDPLRVGSKIGLNRGIPIRWLVQNLAEVGINLGGNRAISDIRVTRAQMPASADEYFIAGVNKFVEPGDNVVIGKQQAIQEFSTAIRLNPRYQYAYFSRAYVYEQVREFQKSLSDYNQVIFLNPKDSAAYNNRALLKAEKLNDIPGALSDYNQAILLNPKDSAAYNNRALLKDEKLNDIPGALSDYNQAILLNPKDSEAYNNRAVLKVNKLNDIPGALSDYNQAILLNPKDFAAYYNRANLKKNKLNDIPGALSDYNQAILFNLKYSEAYNNRAVLKADKLNDISGALSDYNQAILLNPKYSAAYQNRAVLKEKKLNDILGALSDYNQAILLNPKYSKAYNNRAVLKEEKLNDILGALSDYNQAILLNPKYSKAYNNRAVLKEEKLNDIPGAIQDFRQAARLFREQGNTQNLELAIRNLQRLGVSE
jgi:tetratricopeptide (TPR) repeat protein/S1-C subfamily serine protease